MAKDHIFRNWAKNHECHPEEFLRPQTEGEIVDIVKRANVEGKSIRMVGSGHSWSSIACSDKYLVNLDLYNEIVEIDKEKKQVTVQGGIRLKELNELLEQNDLALTNLGSISEQSVAGAVSTGTHGTGIEHGILSTQIVRLSLITASGMVLRLSADGDSELWNAALVSLGCLGIISTVTIQCSTRFKLEEKAYPVIFEEAVEQIAELLKSNEHIKLWWFPHVKQLQVYCFNKTDLPSKNAGGFLRWLDEKLLAKYVFNLLLQLGIMWPKLVPFINRFIKVLKFKKEYRIDKSYRVFNTPMPPIHRESEYAIPIEHTAVAMKEIKQMISDRGIYVNFLLEARFVKGDNCLLSPAYDRDTCYLGAYRAGEKGWDEYMSGFEEIMHKYGGRPHWGKEFSIVKADLEKLYPKFEKFQEIRNKLDPNNIFVNVTTGENC